MLWSSSLGSCQCELIQQMVLHPTQRQPVICAMTGGYLQPAYWLGLGKPSLAFDQAVSCQNGMS